MRKVDSKGLYSPVEHRPCFQTVEFNETPKNFVLIMMEYVLESLATTDRICLALTCKRLLACYQIFTQHGKELCAEFISGVLPSEQVPVRFFIFGSLSLVQRTELLLRLQTGNLKYCIECEYLHRRTRWSILRSYLNYDSYGQCSSPRARILHICPCLSISLYQQHQFATGSWKVAVSALTEKILSACSRSADLGCHGEYFDLEHECTFSNHPLVTVRIKSRAWFDKNTRTLQVMNTFRFDVSRAGPSELAVAGFGRASSKMCVHGDTETWLNKFFRENKSNFNVGCRGSHRCD